MKEIIFLIILMGVIPPLFYLQKTIGFSTAQIYAESEVVEDGVSKKITYNDCIKYNDKEITLDEVVEKRLIENNIDPKDAKIEISQPCD